MHGPAPKGAVESFSTLVVFAAELFGEFSTALNLGADTSPNTSGSLSHSVPRWV